MHGAEATCREQLGVGERLREGADSRRAYPRRGRRVNLTPCPPLHVVSSPLSPSPRCCGEGGTRVTGVRSPVPSTRRETARRGRWSVRGATRRAARRGLG